MKKILFMMLAMTFIATAGYAQRVQNATALKKTRPIRKTTNVRKDKGTISKPTLEWLKPATPNRDFNRDKVTRPKNGYGSAAKETLEFLKPATPIRNFDNDKVTRPTNDKGTIAKPTLEWLKPGGNKGTTTIRNSGNGTRRR